MQTMTKLTVLLAAAAVAVSAQAAVTEINLSHTATTFGLLPNVTLDQGFANGVEDGNEWGTWVTQSPVTFTSPTVFFTNQIGVYMTWATDQSVRSARVWKEYNNTYTEVYVDTLNASGSATNETDWTVRSSNTGLGSVNFLDMDLGAAYQTKGVRVRVKNNGETATRIGEIGVYGPAGAGGIGTLSSHRATASSVIASSVGWGAVAAGASDANWLSRWLSDTPAANTGTDYTYDINFSGGTNVGGATLLFNTQSNPGIAEMPTSWELLVDQGSGLTSLGTFSPTMAQNGYRNRQLYTYDFGQLYTGVIQLQLRVPESAVVNGVSLMEFEALDIPEPASLLLLMATGALLFLRRRR